MPMERSMIDDASGGDLEQKTTLVAKVLIANIVANSQQFSNRLDLPQQKVNEDIVTSNIKQKLASLISLVHQFIRSPIGYG